MDIKITETNMTPQTSPTAPVKNTSDDFSFTLGKVSDHNMEARLRGMMDEINEVGKKLAEHIDINDLKNYRSMVTGFLQEVVSESHRFSRENFLDRRGRHRVYGIIRMVNQRLDELAQEFLKAEKNHIKILETIDEIRGLLLDILL